MNPMHLLATLPAFLAYLGIAIALTALYAIIYTAITPHPEWKLLREGNISAALAFGGSLLGFVLPLGSTIAHSVSMLDLAVWGAVALLVQILSFFVLRLFLPTLPADIEADKRGVGTICAFFFVAVGILNAACLTW